MGRRLMVSGERPERNCRCLPDLIAPFSVVYTISRGVAWFTRPRVPVRPPRAISLLPCPTQILRLAVSLALLRDLCSSC
jgi:hypothetical protein